MSKNQWFSLLQAVEEDYSTLKTVSSGEETCIQIRV